MACTFHDGHIRLFEAFIVAAEAAKDAIKEEVPQGYMAFRKANAEKVARLKSQMGQAMDEDERIDVFGAAYRLMSEEELHALSAGPMGATTKPAMAYAKSGSSARHEAASEARKQERDELKMECATIARSARTGTKPPLPLIRGVADFIGSKSRSQSIHAIHGKPMMTRPGAFAAAIRRGGIKALWSHNEALEYGSTDGGNLWVHEWNNALIITLDPKGEAGAELVEKVRTGAVGLSIGWDHRASTYKDTKVGWEMTADYSAVALTEISFTCKPCVSGTLAICDDDLRKCHAKTLASFAFNSEWATKPQARHLLYQAFVAS